jgi:hypothetical protein
MTSSDQPTPQEQTAAAARRKVTMDRFHRLRRRRLLGRVGIGLAVAVVAIAVPVSLTGSNNPPARVVVGSPTTSIDPSVDSTIPPSTIGRSIRATTTTLTPPSTPVAASAPTTASSTSTTIHPRCTNQQFTARATTDHPTYTRGQTVNITVTVTNSGLTCEGGVAPDTCGPVSIYDISHTDVWDLGAGPDSPLGLYNCGGALIQTIVHGWSSTQRIGWSQDRCTLEMNGKQVVPNPNCPGTQVPDGTYTVVADNGAAPTVTIDIAG